MNKRICAAVAVCFGIVVGPAQAGGLASEVAKPVVVVETAAPVTAADWVAPAAVLALVALAAAAAGG